MQHCYIRLILLIE
jgi:mannan endo-1,4-beta-mannosidase